MFPHRLKLGKSLQTCCVKFFHLDWYFKCKKSVFWKASFFQNKNWYACNTLCPRLHDLVGISKIWPPYHVVASSPQKFLATDQIIISGKSTLSSLGRQKTLTHNLFNIYVQICTNIFGTSRTEGGLPVVFAGHILISSWFTQTLPTKHNDKFCCPSAKCV